MRRGLLQVALQPFAFGFTALASGQDFDVPLGDAGTYPASAIANAFAFEHFVHIHTASWLRVGH